VCADAVMPHNEFTSSVFAFLRRDMSGYVGIARRDEMASLLEGESGVALQTRRCSPQQATGLGLAPLDAGLLGEDG
jgi:hypothetical protein